MLDALTLSATMDGAKRIPAVDATLERAIATLRATYAEWATMRKFGKLGFELTIEAGHVVGGARVMTTESVK